MLALRAFLAWLAPAAQLPAQLVLLALAGLFVLFMLRVAGFSLEEFLELLRSV